MMTLQERTEKLKKKQQQLKQKIQLEENRAQKEKEKMEHRRKCILGEIVLEFLPDFSKLKPCSTAEENRMEFAEFRGLMESLAESIRQSKKFEEKISDRFFDGFDSPTL